MNISLHVCDDISLPLTNRFEDYANCLDSKFKFASVVNIEVGNLHSKKELPSSADECDVYIADGSPSSVNDELPWISYLSVFIRSEFHAEKGLLGICCGQQVIHHALGVSIRRSDKGWGLGAYSVEFYKSYDGFKESLHPRQSRLKMVKSLEMM
ncbi:hypothetical protein [Neptunomonas sp.]|uniref:hypothetical protein n=1 Tax=Neptunomonas sp. TaxID=1971898 RepID=UPI00356A054C